MEAIKSVVCYFLQVGNKVILGKSFEFRCDRIFLLKMKPEIDWLEYQRLELLTDDCSKNLSWRSQFKRFGNFLRQHLTASSQLRVWHICDPEGKIWWSAYDPITKQFINRVSEEQICIWIERRY